MRDIDIRRALLSEMARRHLGDTDTLIVEELGLCQGSARVDLAVVNGSFHGYEIKSDRDTLLRLPSQTEAYNRALEFVTIVVSPVHLEKARELVPAWWGLVKVVQDESGVGLKQIRMARPNPEVVPYAVAQFLWRDEALQVLSNYGLEKGIRSKTREHLWKRLATEFTIEQLGREVRETLKRRGPTWRLPAPTASDGD